MSTWSSEFFLKSSGSFCVMNFCSIVRIIFMLKPLLKHYVCYPHFRISIVENSRVWWFFFQHPIWDLNSRPGDSDSHAVGTEPARHHTGIFISHWNVVLRPIPSCLSFLSPFKMPKGVFRFVPHLPKKEWHTGEAGTVSICLIFVGGWL